MKTILIIIEALVILVLILYIILNKRQMNSFLRQSELIKKRRMDLDDIEIRDRNNSNAILADAMNVIKNNMLTFLESTKGNVVILSDAIDVLSHGAHQNQDGSQRIADSLTVVVNKVEEQLEMVRACLELIEENTGRLTDIDDSIKGISVLLTESVDSCASGVENLEKYERNIDSVSRDLAKSEQILVEFTKKIGEINEIGSFIVSISESLKMLALNASIEAARVGAAGSGFAVVAKEMGVMSEKTQEGIGTINSILDSVTESSRQVNKCIRECVIMFEESSKEFDAVSASFRKIDNQSSVINERMQSIFESIQNITNSSMVTKNQAQKAYTISEEITAGTQEISQVSIETSEASGKIINNVDSLNNMLKGLEVLLRQFTTSVEPVKEKAHKKIKIGVICIVDNEFWVSVRRGSIYAKKELESCGAEVRYLPYYTWPEVDANCNHDIEKMIEEDFDGYIMPGFFANGRPELIEKIYSLGKKVYLFNCDSDNPEFRNAVFQPDVYEAGIIAAKAIEKALNKRGQIVELEGDTTIPVNKIRSQAFQDYFAKPGGCSVTVVSVGYSDEEAYETAKECIANYPDMKGMFITTGTPLPVARAIEESGRDIKLVMFDHSQEIFRYIQKGIIAAAIGQDPFGQGHDPVIWMYNTIVTGQPLPSEFMKCRANVVDKENVDSLVGI